MSSARELALAPLPRSLTVTACGLVLAMIAVLARAAALASLGTGHPQLITAAATFDLTVTDSLVAWWMLRREFGWSARALVALFFGSMMVAGLILPAGQEGALWFMHVAVAPLELLLIVYLFRRIAKARRGAVARRSAAGGLDVQDMILGATSEIVGTGRFAEVLAYEISVLYYALARRPGSDATFAPTTEAGETGAGNSALTYHRQSAYGPVVVMLALVTLAEIPALHLFVRTWSVPAAWICTALGVYGLLWILGDWRACRSRLVSIEDGALHIRFGLRWRLDAALDDIVGVRAPTVDEEMTKGAVDLKLALPGASWRILELDRPVVARGPYGIRRTVRTLGLGLDEPDRLDAALAATRPDAEDPTPA